MSMKRLLLFGIVSYLVFLCIYAPAQLLGSLLGQLTGNRLGLAAAQGSLWKGNANLLLNDHGTGPDHNSPIFFEVGLKAGLWNFFEIYIPLLVSENIQSAVPSFNSRIRLIFNLNSFNQTKLNSGLGIQIR